MNFADIEKMVIPEGEVEKITVGGTVIWEMPQIEFLPHTNLVPTAVAPNGGIFNGTGYAHGRRIELTAGKYATSTFDLDGADYTTVGIITGVNSKKVSVYTYGFDFNARVGDFLSVITSSNMYSRWHAQKLKDGYTKGSKLTVTKLANHYFKLDLVFATNIDAFAFSGVTGTSGVPIVTINEPLM